MTNNNDGLDCFDDKEAIDYILKHITSQFRGKVNEEQVQYITDIEIDFYEMKGVFEEEGDDNAELDFDIEEELKFINDRIATEGRTQELPADLVQAVMEANWEYVESNFD